MTKRRTEWIHGDRAAVAKAVGISPQYLSDMMRNRKEVSPTMARSLEKACSMLGYSIPRTQWAFPEKRANNPLFPEQLER